MTPPSRRLGGLAITERGYEALLETAPDAMVIVDRDGRIVLANAQAERLFGYTREELLGQPVECLIPERFGAVHRRHRRAYNAAPRTRPMGIGLELFARRRDGSEFPAEISLSPLETEHGLLVTSIIRDITERKQAEAERARLLASEQAARSAAEQAADRLRRLQAVTDTALAHLSLDALLDQSLDRIREALDVETAIIMLVDPADGTLRPAAARGLTDPHLDEVRVPLGTGFAGRVAAERRAVIADDPAELAQAHPRLWQDGLRALLGAPLVVEGHVIGVVQVGTARPRAFTEGDAELLQRVADRIALAVDRARAYEAERAARAATEAAEQRAAFLAQASALLASTLDYETTLASVARLAVPVLADWCTIDLIEDGSVARVAAAHSDPAREALLRAMVRRYPGAPPASTPLWRVLQRGQAEIVAEVTEDDLPTITRPETLDIVRQVGVSSLLVAPLIARGRSLGAISLIFHESGRRYSAADLPLVENLAQRAALAVDNARLYYEAERAREQTERQAARLALLAKAARDFAEASLDLPTILETVSGHVAEILGPCAIGLLAPDQARLDPVVVHHPDPDKRAALRARPPIPLRTDAGLLAPVMADGRPVHLAHVDPAELDASLLPEQRTDRERCPVESLLIAPLSVRARSIGALMVWREEPGAPYTEDDLVLLQELADRAALAVDNAMLYREAQQAVLAREEFLSVASHELKTPLTTVKGWVYLLVDALRQPELDREAIREFVSELQAQVDRFEGLIADLLDASRIQQGRIDLRPEPVVLNELARRVLARFEHAPERTPRHTLALEAPEQIVGIWDPDRLEQVLTNLVSNALKYSPDGGEVRLRLGRSGDEAELTVSDQGIGIAPADQARLFQPFTRAERARQLASGTGLGLYITQRIVREHGGTIALESTPGQGTTVTVRLPIAPFGGTPAKA
ncbi:MAG: GAF domain-containing protein [Sphaerobacter sp.]|nr:GAF domain-containing protein [Sphaerobacter sp.]